MLEGAMGGDVLKALLEYECRGVCFERCAQTALETFERARTGFANGTRISSISSTSIHLQETATRLKARVIQSGSCS